MKAFFICTLMVLSLSNVSFASTCSEISGGIVKVRDSLLTMLKDKSKRTPEQKKLVQDSCNRVTDLIAQLQYNKAKESEYNEMKNIWAEFKKVREEKVVPLLESGNDSEAEKLVTGEQKERLMKVMSICPKVQ